MDTIFHIYSCAKLVCADGQWLAGGGEDGKITFWRMHNLMGTSQPLADSRLPHHTLAGHQSGIDTLVFSPDSQLLFSGGRDRLIHGWQAATWIANRADQTETEDDKPWQTLHSHQHLVRCLAISPNGRFLASGSADNTVRIWDTHDGRLLDTLTEHDQWVWAVAFHPQPDGETQILASGGNDQQVFLWEVSTQAGVPHNRLRQTLSGYSDAVRSVAFTPDGQTLVSGGFDKLIHFWHVNSGRHYTTLRNHADWLFKLAISPDGNFMASSDFECLIYLWPCSTKRLAEQQELVVRAPTKLQGHTGVPCGLAFSPVGAGGRQLLASCGHDSTIRLWHVPSGQLLETLTGHTGWLREVAFSPDGRLLASSGFDQTVRLWDVYDLTAQSPTDLTSTSTRSNNTPVSPPISNNAPATHPRLLQTFTDHTAPAWGVAFSPDGKYVISTANDQTVRVRDLSGQQQRVLTGHTNAVRTLASASEEGDICLWDVQRGTTLQTLRPDRPYTGMEITGVTGITPAQKKAQVTLGAIEKP